MVYLNKALKINDVFELKTFLIITETSTNQSIILTHLILLTSKEC